jgi:hypothetical protein
LAKAGGCEAGDGPMDLTSDENEGTRKTKDAVTIIQI